MPETNPASHVANAVTETAWALRRRLIEIDPNNRKQLDNLDAPNIFRKALELVNLVDSPDSPYSKVPESVSLEPRTWKQQTINHLHSAITIRNAVSHLKEERQEPTQLATPAGAFSALQQLLSLLRLYSVNERDENMEKLTKRQSELAGLVGPSKGTKNALTRRASPSNRFLLVISPREKGTHIPILSAGAESVILGRATGTTSDILDVSEYSYDPGQISRRHCRLGRSNTGYEVQDLGSTNGTLLNGKQIGTLGSGAQRKESDAFPVSKGDIIEICDVQLRFE